MKLNRMTSSKFIHGDMLSATDNHRLPPITTHEQPGTNGELSNVSIYEHAVPKEASV